MNLVDIFGPGGLLAKQLGPSYHFRQGQLDMASLVAQGIHSGQHVVVEAGTGIGKTFAYLIPLLQQRRRCIVSTANKTLQSQLVEKDLPFLQNVLPGSFTFALLKGRQNYICNLRLSDLLLKPSASTDLSALADVNVTLAQRPDGDLDSFDLPMPLRQDLTIEHEDCLGPACRFHAQCYYQVARIKAEAAQVVVVNHALLARAVLGQGLELRDQIVIDEANELAHYIADALGRQITFNRIIRTLHGGYVQRCVRLDVLQQTERDTGRLFARLGYEVEKADMPRVALTTPELLQAGQDVSHKLGEIVSELARQAADFEDDEEARAHFALALRRASNLAADAQAAFASADDDNVRYLEAAGDENPGQTRVTVNMQPLLVDGVLHDRLFKQIPSAICTSATLAVAGRFDYFRQEVGLASGLALIEQSIPSPYDYKQQALLYIPRNLTPPKNTSKHAWDAQAQVEQQQFLERLQQEILQLLQASGGRALVLFTSKARMNACYEAIRRQIPYTCYLQGQLPRMELIRRFRDEVTSVLFATRSFWAGLDIAGESLSLVIVERPPFPAPKDPVYQKREALLAQNQAGVSAWDALSIPQATLDLRQAIGRLIRNESDRGVAAILDSRLIQKPYGKRILGSLPFNGYVTDVSRVAAFYQQPAPVAVPTGAPPRPAAPTARPIVPPPPASPVPQPAPHSMAPSPGLPPSSGLPVLPGYRFIKRLGTGGYGVVYEAEHAALGRRVAIKELSPDKQADPQALQRFLLEAKTAANLNHPAIVKVHDLIPAGGHFYLVMEYLDGGTLRDKLAAGPLPPAEVVQLGLDMCGALALVHSKAIIHRDIKPENILFAADSREARLTDFGIAHVPKGAAGLSATLTGSGVQPGTVVYMSPEQVAGGRLDGRSDLYTLAAVLYEALTGDMYVDFDSCSTLLQVLQCIVQEPPRPIAASLSVPPELVKAIERGLQKSPDQRFSSADEMAHALVGAHSTNTQSPAPVPAVAPLPAAPRPSLLERLRRTLERSERSGP